MSMFNRTDKAPETTAPMRTAMAEPTSQPAAETKLAAAPAKPMTQPVSAPSSMTASVISKALKITGQLESTENIQIEGEVDGDIRGVSVKVGRNAKIKGTVYGEDVELAGTVEGKIEAKKVVLTSTAHMSGDVIHQDITIESGAFIDGQCRPDFGKSQPQRSSQATKPVMHAADHTAEKANGAASL